jgi:hypothetical protein
MQRFMPWFGAVFAALVPALALAAALDDIQALIVAGKPPTEIIEAVHQHKGEWLPHDVYALIDSGAPPEVIKAVAAHAVVFYDGVNPKSLVAIAAEARQGIPPQTVSATDMLLLFEWFADEKAEADQLRASVPALEPMKDGETQSQYDIRKRTYDEDLVRTVTQADGKIDVTTFHVDLPASFSADAKGCAVGSVLVSLDAVNYFTFRAAMGTTAPKVPLILKKSRSIASGEFDNGETKAFRLTSKPVCGPPAAGLSSGKAVFDLSRTAKGGDWAVAGEFFKSSGEVIPVSSH